MNYSRQREMIFNSVKASCEHPTAEMLHQSLKKDHPALSLATVYRNLNQLSELGMLKRLHITNFPDRFDGNCKSHYHLSCHCCNNIVDIEPMQVSEDALQTMFMAVPHQVEECDIILYGVCRRCLEKQMA